MYPIVCFIEHCFNVYKRQYGHRWVYIVHCTIDYANEQCICRARFLFRRCKSHHATLLYCFVVCQNWNFGLHYITTRYVWVKVMVFLMAETRIHLFKNVSKLKNKWTLFSTRIDSYALLRQFGTKRLTLLLAVANLILLADTQTNWIEIDHCQDKKVIWYNVRHCNSINVASHWLTQNYFPCDAFNKESKCTLPSYQNTKLFRA